MVTKLSAHFALEELTASQTAARFDLNNTPTKAALAALTDAAARMEVVRNLLGNKVITISSGYRSPAVNKKVRGVPTSAHVSGHAIDFNCYGYGDPKAICATLAAADRKVLPFDQLIEEGTWVHISFAPAMRRQVLTK
uniref:D-Ala-D-Ala carboxypeptidase family metallohydrolase n=1 Tax=Phenylobacterium sp. TaxID=1871053 RepID=UPI00286AA3A3